MRFRSQLSPITADWASQISSSYGSADADLSPGNLAKWKNVEFVRCKMVYRAGERFRVKPFNPPARTNWNALLGICGAAVVSATVWAGVAWTVGMIWK
jgi:hypothetical protein